MTVDEAIKKLKEIKKEHSGNLDIMLYVLNKCYHINNFSAEEGIKSCNGERVKYVSIE